jgi:hypothetical protein
MVRTIAVVKVNVSHGEKHGRKDGRKDKKKGGRSVRTGRMEYRKKEGCRKKTGRWKRRT